MPDEFVRNRGLYVSYLAEEAIAIYLGGRRRWQRGVKPSYDIEFRGAVLEVKVRLLGEKGGGDFLHPLKTLHLLKQADYVVVGWEGPDDCIQIAGYQSVEWVLKYGYQQANNLVYPWTDLHDIEELLIWKKEAPRGSLLPSVPMRR